AGPRPALLPPPGARRRPLADRGGRRRAAPHDPARALADPRAGQGAQARREDRGEQVRLALLAAGAVGLAALLLWGMSGLGRFGSYPGPYGDVLNSFAVSETKATDVVSAVN